jgi:hypothetical protein
MKTFFTSLLFIIFSTSIFAQGSFNNGLVGFYPFSGNATDSSGNGNHGTINAGVSPTTDRKGNPNKAYYFNGNTNAFISIPSSTSNNTGAMSNFAISLWFQSSGAPTIQRRLFTIQDNVPRNYDLAYDYITNKIYYANYHPVPSYNELYSKSVLTANTWNHVVLRIDSLNRTELFVNGVLDTFSTSTVVKPVNPIVSIGRNLTNNWNFQGSIDEVRLYNRYLTNSEIQSLAFDQPIYKDYYSKSSGDLNLLSTWGTNTDGSGTSPLSFDSSYCRYFVLNNNAPTIGNNWNINGIKSIVILGDNINTLSLSVPLNRSISCDSIFLRNGSTLNVFGSIAVNGLGAANTSTVQFLGATPQNISKGTYYNLTVNASTKTLLGNVTVANNLTLLNHINCNSFLLTLGSSANQTGTLIRSSGIVIGSFARWYSNSITSGNNGLFSIGSSSSLYNPIQVNFTTAPTVGGLITAQYFNNNPGTAGMPLFDGIQFLDMVGKNGFWRLTTSNGISGGTSSVSCLANGFWGISDFTSLRLVKRSTGGAWVLSGNAGTNTGSNSAPEIIRTGITTLTGEYGVAGDFSTNPLPVKLISFSAIRVKEGVDLSWKTAEEINNAGFEIERSNNGFDFKTLGFVEGNKNSSTVRNYFFKDEKALVNEESYYRLKQIDFDAKYSYSNVIKLNSLDGFIDNFKVSPNPFKEYLQIQLNTSDIVQIQLFDFKGKEVLRKELVDLSGENSYNLKDLNELPSGLYVLKVTQNNQVRSVKLIKE